MLSLDGMLVCNNPLQSLCRDFLILNKKYVGAIWLPLLIKHIYLTNAWLNEDQKTNTIKHMLRGTTRPASSNFGNYSTLHSEHYWENLNIVLN